MSIKCKKCDSVDIVKSGFVLGKQRYKCKECNSNFRVGDDREKYSDEERLKVIKIYLENVGIRSIERLTGVSSRMVVYWIRKFSAIIKNKLDDDVRKVQGKEDIEVLELDEMFSVLKKNLANIPDSKKRKIPNCMTSQKSKEENISFYGLLTIGKKTKLLILK
jgi:transposase-like protein